MSKRATRHERRLVAFFMGRRNYPHPVRSVRHYETHISHVFVAGDFVYKLKKAVRFAFVDASTLALRKKWCRLEVRLNRRLTPAMYLGMIPISETREGLGFGRGGKIIEWVVKMQRLPEELMLDRLISKNKIHPNDIRRLITRLTVFFRRAPRIKGVEKYGMPARVKQMVFKNLRECRPFISQLMAEEEWRFLDRAYRQYLTLYKPLFRLRVREHRIIDGHGDLRCENICMTKPVTIFDCVEFEPGFRCGDIANDLAFLLMDLEVRGRADLAQVALKTFIEQTKDRELVNIVPFYKCHRSLVRAKVRALAWLQQPRTIRGKRMRVFARRHFRLALRYTRQFAPPRLIVVGGLIGTGKSTLAKNLAEQLGAAVLRTDEIRLKEFASFRKPGAGFSQGLYAPAVSRQVYQRLIQRADSLLKRGFSVVCDGTFSKNTGRIALRRIARRRGASFHFFECIIPRRLAMRRLAKRYAARIDISEAKPEYYDRLRTGFEPVKGLLSLSEYTRLFTLRSPRATLNAALEPLS